MLIFTSMARRADLILVFIAWAFVELTDAGCNQKIAVKSGEVLELTSPDYPLHFPRRSHCFYDLSTRLSAGDVIYLTVEDVSLSCDDVKNVLDVYDAFNTSPRYLGRICKGGQMKFVAPKENMYLVFKSGNKTSKGFKLKVKAKPEFRQCYNDEAKVILAQSKPQEIVSPFYPFEVAPNVHCRWLLKAPPGHRVSLDILHSDMKGSNDCYNFGLYLFDGKTTYDDEQIAEICSNGMRSYDSSGNYLLVVFSAGPHVLHSGGGVKLAFHSAVVDPDVVPKDYKLLYILIGILLGAVSFTVLMIIVRFFILPARRRAAERRYSPRHRITNLPQGQATLTTIPSEPPPPYADNSRDVHNNRTSNTSKRGLAASFCCCLGHESNTRGDTENDVNAYVSGSTPWTADNSPIGNGSNLNNESMNRVMNLLRSGVPLSEVLHNIYSDELVVGRPHSTSSANEYQELPSISSLRTYSGRSNTEPIYSDTFDSNVSPQFRSVDSGYHDEQLSDVETEYEKDDTDEDNECTDEPTVCNNAESIGRTFEDYSTKASDDDDSRTDSTDNVHDSSSLHNDTTTNNDISDSPIVNNSRNRRLDEEGYEIPSSMAIYNRPDLDGQGEDEPVYQTLRTDIVNL